MKVLVDRNIERYAITHDTVEIERTLTWGLRKAATPIASRRTKLPRPDEHFRIEQIPFLASICAVARSGNPELFSSQELRMERYRQKIRGKGYLGINLLDGVTIKTVPCPKERLILVSPGESVGATEKEQMEFFRSVKHPRFLNIAEAVGPGRIDDAYHLWTAEEAHLDAFLTMDKKFRDAVAKQHTIINSSVEVVTPKELAQLLSLPPTDIEALARSVNHFL